MSGIVTEYRGSPLADVIVTIRPNFPPGNGVKTARTDATGFYRVEGLAEAVIVEAERDGYWPTGFGAFSGDRVLNLTMTKRLELAAGETLHATIWGDSAMSGEDWTGANCDAEQKPCELVRVITPGPGTLTARLTWSDRAAELGVFISTGFFGGNGAHGLSPIEAFLDVRGRETLIVVSFERVGGARPPHQSTPGQSFELTTSFSPAPGSVR